MQDRCTAGKTCVLLEGACINNRVFCSHSQYRSVQSPLPAAQCEACHPPGCFSAPSVLGRDPAREPRSGSQHQHDPHFSHCLHRGRTADVIDAYIHIVMKLSSKVFIIIGLYYVDMEQCVKKSTHHKLIINKGPPVCFCPAAP